MFDWIGAIVIGFIVGVIAKMIMPGEKAEPQGCLMTILLGIGGSIVANQIFVNVLGLESMAGFIGSVLGALLLIFVFRKLIK